MGKWGRPRKRAQVDKEEREWMTREGVFAIVSVIVE